MRHVAALLVLFACGLSSAAAQQPTKEWVFDSKGDDIVLELGGGIRVRPDYEGAKDYTLRPWPAIELGFLRLPGLGTFGGGAESGIAFKPSFRIISKRDDSDAGLAGLGDVDLAVEAGGTISYRTGMLRGLVTLRRGFGGHHGFVGETGLDLIAAPTLGLEVAFGPRIHFADSDYLDTYLGVTPSQSAASGLPVFDPDGGFKGVGLNSEAKYRLTESWSVVGEASYERLVGDAADSPVTDRGSRNQFTGALGLTYRFGLDLFD